MIRKVLTAIALVALAAPAAAEPPAAKAAPSTAPFVAVPLPAKAGEGKPKEHKLVADTVHQKSVVITLRKGTVLPPHSSQHAAILQSLGGKGVVRMGDKTVELSPTSMVLLEPGVTHEVVPDAGGDLIVLVHHLKTGHQAK